MLRNCRLLFCCHVCLSNLKHVLSHKSPLNVCKTVFSHLKWSPCFVSLHIQTCMRGQSTDFCVRILVVQTHICRNKWTEDNWRKAEIFTIQVCLAYWVKYVSVTIPHFLWVYWRDNPRGMLGEHEKSSAHDLQAFRVFSLTQDPSGFIMPVNP